MKNEKKFNLLNFSISKNFNIILDILLNLINESKNRYMNILILYYISNNVYMLPFF